MAANKKRWTIDRLIGYILLVGGLVGSFAAIVLTVEYIKLLKNPHYVPVCNLNPIFSCSSVTTSAQAHAFGIPNEILGIAGFAGVAAIGLGILAGAKYKAWFWKLMNLGLLFAFVFITWLQFQTIYRINALCIFCMVTWAVTIPTFWYTTVYNLRQGNLKAPKSLNSVSLFIQRFPNEIMLTWFLLLIVLILKHFWYYFGTLI
jgi:uncharacterized membrane protein